MFKKEAKVIEAGKKLDFSDLYADRVLMFEKHYYIPLFTILGLVLPTLIPYVFFDENLWTAFYTCVVFRVTIILHHFFTVNSLGKWLIYSLQLYSSLIVSFLRQLTFLANDLTTSASARERIDWCAILASAKASTITIIPSRMIIVRAPWVCWIASTRAQ